MGGDFFTYGAMQLAGSLLGAQAAKSAAQQQTDAYRAGTAEQRAMFDIINQQQAPYREAGYGALTRLNEMLPMLTSMPTAEQVKAMPGYQFGLEQGLGSVSQGLNVASPGANVDRARIKFGADYALNQALPAYMKQRESIYNTLAGISGLGQVSTGQTTQAGMSAGTNLANLAVGQGTALAGGTVGAANALSGGLQNIGNAQMLYSLLAPQQQQQPTYLSSMIGQSAPANYGLYNPNVSTEGGLNVPTYSDIRLKKNITKLGMRPDGLGVYEFEYLWGGPRRVGLMAQEVQELYPHAVQSDADGFLMVNYSEV